MTWAPDGAPFCWQPKEALDRIDQGVAPENAATAKLVYLALTRIAADEGAATFTAPIRRIACMASVNRRTVERRLPDLERLGLLTVIRRGLRETLARDSSEFTLATLCREVTTLSRKVTTLSRNPLATLSRKVATSSRRYIVENNKKGIEDTSLSKVIAKPTTTAQRIALENQKKILERKQRELRDDTADEWQRREAPDKLIELRNINQQLKAIEEALLP